MNEAVLKQLNLPPDQPSLIVDAGCGAGATLRHIVRQIPKVSAKGISLAPWLLEKGKTLNKQEGLDARIELIKADFQSIPLPDGCADAVFCLESVCYASGKKKEQLIQELYRVLKPGGRLVIVDAFRKQPSPMPLFFEKLFQRNAQLWAVEKLAILPLFEKTLTSTGFIKINIQDISWRSAPTALHIPFVVGRLLWHGTWRRNQYWKALLMTSITGLLMHWMGYYLITGTKQ